jgi:hypothetical protein
MASKEVIRADAIRAVAIRVLNGIPNSFRETSSGRISSTILKSVAQFLQYEWDYCLRGHQIGELYDNAPNLKKVLAEVESQFDNFQQDDEMGDRAIVLQIWLTKNTCDLAAYLSQCMEGKGTLESVLKHDNNHELVYQIFMYGQDIAHSARMSDITRTAESQATACWCGEMKFKLRLSRTDKRWIWVYDQYVWASFGGQREESVQTEQDILSIQTDGSVASTSLSEATDDELMKELLRRSSRSGSPFSLVRSLVEQLDAALASTLDG